MLQFCPLDPGTGFHVYSCVVVISARDMLADIAVVVGAAASAS